MNAIGDAFLALPVIRHVVGILGSDRVVVWSTVAHGLTVYAELGAIFVPSEETNANNAARRKEVELELLLRKLRSDARLYWISLNSYWPLTVVEQHAINTLDPAFVWSFDAPNVRRATTEGPLLHRIDQYFRVIGERTTPDAVDRKPRLAGEASREAAELLARSHTRSKRMIAVHAETRPAKSWPDDRWRKLGLALRQNADIFVLGRSGQALAQSAGFAEAPLGWDRQIALLSKADAFVGVDSCFAHIADALGVPGVVLFGNHGPVEQWGPKGPALVAVNAPRGDLRQLAVEVVHAQLQLQQHFREVPFLENPAETSRSGQCDA